MLKPSIAKATTEIFMAANLRRKPQAGRYRLFQKRIFGKDFRDKTGIFREWKNVLTGH
jgi:hypothetical protein